MSQTRRPQQPAGVWTPALSALLVAIHCRRYDFNSLRLCSIAPVGAIKGSAKGSPMRTQNGQWAVRRLRHSQRMSAVAVVMALVAASIPSIIRSEDARSELPSDGAWVRYRAEIEYPGVRTDLYDVTLSMVGSVMEDGKRCRWVEKKGVPQGGLQPGKTAYVLKMLIPETALLESDYPARHAIRTWLQKPDGAIVELPPIDPERSRNADERIFMCLWTPGSRKTQTRIDEPKDIDYQNGRLKGAQAWTVTYVLSNTGPKRDRKYETTYTIWQHAELPIGSAEVRLRDEEGREGKLEPILNAVYRLDDFGSDAKSALPDHQ